MSSAASRTGTWPATEPVLVYGDHVENADPGERLRRIAAQLTRIGGMQAGIDRHAKLVGALIDAGQLLQGFADAGLSEEQALSGFVHRLAQSVVRSWDSSFDDIGELPSAPSVQASATVELRQPEGFAFYGVYPEAYVEAARRLRLSAPPRVIGIRSIGTTLGAVVAATLVGPPAFTVRPFGDPFARRVKLPENVLGGDAHYVIVDEGPGLSGSSFGAVADWLEERGVPIERIAFLPSHRGNPGRQASEAHLRRWKRAQRVPADFGGKLADLVRTWAGGQLGPADDLKFAGLGTIGEGKFEMARALHAAGFTREPLRLVHGFLIERGCEGAGVLAADEKPIPEIARYIVARANLFPAEEAGGASIEQLVEMCRRNISLAFGDEAVPAMNHSGAASLQRFVRRVRTDNRMDRDNWLRTPAGRLIKIDALDHHHGHDLIGCQDVAWDVAGAIVELGLTGSDSETLIGAVEQGGRTVCPELLAFYRVAYVAFRLGQATLAEDPSKGRYASALRNILHQHVCTATRQDSLVG